VTQRIEKTLQYVEDWVSHDNEWAFYSLLLWRRGTARSLNQASQRMK